MRKKEKNAERERERVRERRFDARLTGVRPRLASAHRQVLKHCNLDSLLAIVKTQVQSVDGLTGLMSVGGRSPPTSYMPLSSVARSYSPSHTPTTRTQRQAPLTD